MAEVIATARLLLRGSQPSDHAAITRLLTDPVTRRYLGGRVDDERLEHVPTAELTPQWGSFLIVDTASSDVLGGVRVERAHGALEVSYELLPEFVGCGYASEAVAAALSWAADACPDDDEIVAVTQAANERSLALLNRLGFVERERFEEYGAEQVLAVRALR